MTEAGGPTAEGGTRLRAPANRVDRRSVTLWRLRALAAAIPAAAVCVYLLWSATGEVGVTAAVTVPLAAVALGYAAVMPLWRYRVHGWEVAAEAVYARSGWLVQEWRIAPMSRIQTVDSFRGPLQQWLGISTVTITTASAAGAIEIEALDRDVAEQLVQRLTEVTEAAPGDAT